MRTRGRASIVGLLAGVLAATLLVPVTAPVHADAHRNIELERFFDLAVDEANGHVFVSQGRRTDELVVLDLQGRLVQAVPGMGNAHGLVLSDDGTRLFVGLAAEHAIVEIDTSTLEVVAEHTLPKWLSGDQLVPSCPHDLTVLDGFVVFGDQCREGPGALHMLDPTSGDVVATLPTGVGGERLVMAADQHILLATGFDSVISYDVVTGDTPAITWRGESKEIPGSNDLAVIPGTGAVAMSGGKALAIDDLSVVGSYPVRAPQDGEYRPYSKAVAARPDGMVGFGYDRRGEWDLRTFLAPGTPAVRTYTLVDRADPYRYDELLNFGPRSLEFGAQMLYGIEIDDYDNKPRFWAIRPRSATKVHASTRNSSYVRGTDVRVRIRVEGPTRARRGEAHIWISPYDYRSAPFRLDGDQRGSFRFTLRRPTRVEVIIDDRGDLVADTIVVGVRR